MPGWLQTYNDWQPVSVTVKAMRSLTIGGETATPVFHAVLWMVALVAIFVPLAVSRYRRAA
jgi:ABC-type polysaccharide/polyol phosphate export permease